MAAVEPDTNPLLDAALNYAAQGIEVFPCVPASRAPYVTNGFKDASRDEAQIRAWWGRWPTALIAARIPEHLVVVDIDPKHKGDTTWQLLEEMYGPVATGRWHASGRGDGGRHLWFNRPDGKLNIRGLNQWAKDNGVGEAAGNLSWTAGIDLLHHDMRYSILPPSPHPINGKPYTWGAQGEADDMPPWLTHILTTEPEGPPRPARTQLRIADENSVADWFSANTSWHDILAPAGWHLVGGSGDDDGSRWRHPNATAKHSATVRHGCLFVYSGNTDFEETESGSPHGYTRFRAWATLEYGADMSAAAYGAIERRDGIAAEPVDHSFIDELTGPQQASDTLGPADVGQDANDQVTASDQESVGTKAQVTAGAQTPKDRPWPTPVPLVDEVEPRPFPVHLLPSWMGDHAKAIAENLQVAVDLPAILGLGALSVATLGRAKVTYVRQNWSQPLNLYAAVAMPPSAGKSPAKDGMFGALEDYELERINSANMAKLRAESEARILKKRLTDLEESAARTGDPDKAQEASMVAFELAEVTNAPSGRMMADDVSGAEVLGEVLAKAGGAIAVVSAEGGLFDKLAGLYSDKNNANMDLFLEGWSGGRLVVDRIKRDSISIPHANVAVVTTVQPTTLDDIGARREFTGRGLTARFLLALPKSNVGRRDRRRIVVGDAAAAATYNDNIVELARRAATQKVELIVTGKAGALYADWDQSLEDDLASGRALEHLPEWVGKLRANMLRVAALLHLAHGREGTEISVETVEAAIELGEFFVDHARHIADRWATSGEVAQAQRIVEWARLKDVNEFTVKEAFEGLRRTFDRAEHLVPALEMLTEREWLRAMQPGPIVVGRGRTSPSFAVNPQVRTERTERTKRTERTGEVDALEGEERTEREADGGGGRETGCSGSLKRGVSNPLPPSEFQGPPETTPPSAFRSVRSSQEIEADPCPTCGESHPAGMCGAEL